MSREAVEYAQEFEDPVVVMEDLSYIHEQDVSKIRLARKVCLLSTSRLRYISQTRHKCGHISSRPQQVIFRCTNDDRHVTHVSDWDCRTPHQLNGIYKLHIAIDFWKGDWLL